MLHLIYIFRLSFLHLLVLFFFHYMGISQVAAVNITAGDTLHLTAGDTLQSLAEEPDYRMLEEVVIRGVSTHVFRPGESRSVEFVGASYLRENLSGSLMETLSKLPGVGAIGIGSGNSKPLIRGLGFNRVLVAEHGIRHEGQQWGSDHGLEIDQFAIEGVEIIKGPASVLYGSDAIAGVISLIQAAVPQPNTLSATIDFIGKSNNMLMGSSAAIQGRSRDLFFSTRLSRIDYADLKVPVDSLDIYSYRFPLQDGRLRNTAGRELNIHFMAGISRPLWTSRIFVSRLESHSGFFANAHGLEPRRVDLTLHDSSARDILYPQQQAIHIKITNRTVVNLGGLVAIAELGYQRNDRKEFSHYVNHGFMPAVFPRELMLDPELERAFVKDVYSANLKTERQSDSGMNFVLGVGSEHQNNVIDGRNFIIPAFRQFSAGVFAYGSKSLTRRLVINAGLRYDRSMIQTDAYSDWFSTDGEYLLRAPSMHKSFSSLSGAAGMTYHVDDFVLKANIGKSFRVPIAKELAANGVNYHHFSYEKGDSSLQPEISYQIDFDLAHSRGPLRIGLSPFINYFPNYIFLNPDYRFDYSYGAGNQIFYYTSTRVGRIGAELSASYAVTPVLKARIAADYLYSEQLSGNKKGFGLPFAPPPSALFGLTYSRIENASAAEELFSNLFIAIDTRLSARQMRVVPPERPSPAYYLFYVSTGGHLRWSGFAMDINFAIHNVFNSVYQEHTSYYRLIGIPGSGRNFQVSVSIPVDIYK